MKTAEQIKNKKQIAREITRMPYYQVHFTQKMAMDALKESQIPSQIVDLARQNVANKINQFGYYF